MKCKLTGDEGKGIKAHIIPKSFYGFEPEEKRPSKIFTNAADEYTRKSPVGIYDSEILTEVGERMLSSWDDYAADLLLARKDEQKQMVNEGEVVGFEVPKYDFQLLKLFCLSVLWRAHATAHPFFAGVQLGPYEEQIRALLLEGDVNDRDGFDVSLARWVDHPGGSGMLNPHTTKLDNTNYYLIYLGYYIIYVKVDKQSSNNIISQLCMKPNLPLTIIGRDLEDSKERDLMERLVRG